MVDAYWIWYNSSARQTKEVDMTRWQVLRNGIPIAVCSSIEEAEDVYAEFEADEIEEIED